MSASRAVITARWCVLVSFRGDVNLLKPSYLSTVVSPISPFQTLANRGHRLVLQRCVTYNKITKNKLLMNKKRDASYENLMDSEKRMNIMKRVIAILLKQPSQKMLYRYMIRRGRDVGLVKPQRLSDIIKKYPRIIRIYREQNEIEAWVTLAKPILELMEEEKKLKAERTQFSIQRLRKLLMMSSKRRIRLDRINYLKQELGLPDDFKETVVKANPDLFKLVKVGKTVPPMIMVKLVDWDPQLAIPAIEEYRRNEALTKGFDETETKKKAYSFPISFPSGFKIKKGFRIKLKNWQELTYRSPYEETSDLDLQSVEALKRAVAVLHEFLHISVEKRTRIDKIAHLREDLKLPQKVGVTVLQNPGIFYMSTKSNVQTIFLREAYMKGDLIQKDALQIVKKKFLDLLKMSIKKSKTGETKKRVDMTAINNRDGDESNEKEEELDVGTKVSQSGNSNLKEEDLSKIDDEDDLDELEAWSEDESEVHNLNAKSKG